MKTKTTNKYQPVNNQKVKNNIYIYIYIYIYISEKIKTKNMSSVRQMIKMGH